MLDVASLFPRGGDLSANIPVPVNVSCLCSLVDQRLFQGFGYSLKLSMSDLFIFKLELWWLHLIKPNMEDLVLAYAPQELSSAWTN